MLLNKNRTHILSHTMNWWSSLLRLPMMEVPFHSGINIKTDIMILSLSLSTWPHSPPSAGCLGEQWVASHASEVTSQFGRLHLRPQTKLASLWSGTWMFGLPTVLLLIVWQQRRLWQMTPSITPLCFPVLLVTAPARWDKAEVNKSIFGPLDFFSFWVFWLVYMSLWHIYHSLHHLVIRQMFR